MIRKKIAILGSTGSIGENALKVAKHLSDELEVVALAANSRVERLAEQAAEMNCAAVVTADTGLESKLRDLAPSQCQVGAGEQALVDLVTRDDVDIVLCAIVGTGGLMPVIAALQADKDVALASKEVLVLAGKIVMAAAAKSKGRIIPVDSEHSAIFQCLEGRDPASAARLILTASGGAFRNATHEEMRDSDYASALAHPTWSMGPKVTIDSASLMNKALEIIEAHFLFNVPYEKIDVVIHPQSIVHSMVEFIDGTVLAQMSTPDMRFPIQYALTWPHKHPGSLEPLDFTKFSDLTFEVPDRKRFPSLDFAYESLRQGGDMPAVMNAANEVAVEKFRRGEIKFTEIWTIIEKTMAAHKVNDYQALAVVLDTDRRARAFAAECKI
jgi:1-deoxy-D-xylulose-5-phosphate reductoisomerase